MHRPHPKTNDPRWQISQNRPLEKGGWLEGLASIQCPRNQPLLNQRLQGLNDARRPFAPPLDFGSDLFSDVLSLERLSQNIGCNHSILNSVVDPYTTHGRHNMGSVTNQQQSRPMPTR